MDPAPMNNVRTDRRHGLDTDGDASMSGTITSTGQTESRSNNNSAPNASLPVGEQHTLETSEALDVDGPEHFPEKLIFTDIQDAEAFLEHRQPLEKPAPADDDVEEVLRNATAHITALRSAFQIPSGATLPELLDAADDRPYGADIQILWRQWQTLHWNRLQYLEKAIAAFVEVQEVQLWKLFKEVIAVHRYGTMDVRWVQQNLASSARLSELKKVLEESPMIRADLIDTMTQRIDIAAFVAAPSGYAFGQQRHFHDWRARNPHGVPCFTSVFNHARKMAREKSSEDFSFSLLDFHRTEAVAQDSSLDAAQTQSETATQAATCKTMNGSTNVATAVENELRPDNDPLQITPGIGDHTARTFQASVAPVRKVEDHDTTSEKHDESAQETTSGNEEAISLAQQDGKVSSDNSLSIDGDVQDAGEGHDEDDRNDDNDSTGATAAAIKSPRGLALAHSIAADPDDKEEIILRQRSVESLTAEQRKVYDAERKQFKKARNKAELERRRQAKVDKAGHDGQ